MNFELFAKTTILMSQSDLIYVILIVAVLVGFEFFCDWVKRRERRKSRHHNYYY